MTDQSQEAKQTDREPEEKLEIKALFQNKRTPGNILCGESAHGLQLQDHLHIKKEEEELWESLEEKQETDITAVTVKSEDEEEEAQCSLLHWRQSEENIKLEPATCMSCESFQTSENTTKETSHNTQKCFGCDVCGKRSHLQIHTRIHTGDKPFGCDLCEKRFTKRSNYSRHMNCHTGEKPFGCDICGQKFNQKAGLSAHRIIHTGERPFVCAVCGKRLSTRGHLKVHTRSHTGEKPFGCDVCGKRFSTTSRLKSHMRIHTGEKHFGCDVCGKQFSTRTHLKCHMRNHTGEKPFGCDVCGKQFIRKASLSEHMKVHRGEKPYGCDVCGHKFIYKSNLSKHMRIHTGEKPYGCDVCSQKFNNKSNLSKHMRVHTGEKPYGCDEKLGESLEEKHETDITAVTVKSEDEEEEAQCSLLQWKQREEVIKGEPATCCSAKLMKVEPNGDISEGPEAANTCPQPDTDGEETDCSDTEDSEDWREPLSQSEAQSEHMDMSCESFQTSENNTKETSRNKEIL